MRVDELLESGGVKLFFLFFLRVLFGITKLLCCCVDILFWLERWEGVVVIAYVFGRSLVRCEGRRMGRERRVKVTLSIFLLCFC